MKEKISKVISVILAFISLLSINNVSGISNNKYYINSILLLIIFVVLCYLFIKYLNFKTIKSKSTKVFVIIASICLGFLNVFGFNLYTIYTMNLTNVYTYIYGFGMTFIYYTLLSLIVVKYRVIVDYLNNISIKFIDKLLFKRFTFIKCALLILLAWIPILLAFYPGIFSYDAPQEFLEFYNGNYYGGNPVPHAYMVGMLLKIGRDISGSYNIGVLLCTIVQMIIVSFTMAYVISFLNKRKVPFIYKVITLLIFMLLPTHSMFAITTTRDIPFSCAMVLFFIKYFEYYFEDNKKRSMLNRVLNIALIILLAFLVLILRNNGVYGYIFMLVFVAIPLRKYWKSLLISNVILFGMFSCYNSFLDKYAYKIKPGPEREFPIQFIIPFQQLGRLYPNATEEEKQEMDIFMSEVNGKSGWYGYLPRRADGVFVPSKVIYLKEHSKEFWDLYIRLAKKYSLVYVDALFASTSGYWYISDILPENMRPYIEIKCYEPFNISDNQIKFEYKIPWLADLYYDLLYEGNFQKIPVVSLLMSMAVNNVLFVLLLILLICKGKIKYVTPFMLFVGIVGTYLVGPTCILRYIYFIFIGMPIFIYFTNNTINKNKKGEKYER